MIKSVNTKVAGLEKVEVVAGERQQADQILEGLINSGVFNGTGLECVFASFGWKDSGQRELAKVITLKLLAFMLRPEIEIEITWLDRSLSASFKWPKSGIDSYILKTGMSSPDHIIWGLLWIIKQIFDHLRKEYEFRARLMDDIARAAGHIFDQASAGDQL